MSMTSVEGAGRRPAIPYPMDRTGEEQAGVVKQADKQEMKSDSVQISEEGRTRVRGMTQSELESMKEQIESAKQQAEAVQKELDNLAKCFKIAMRIMAGDLVPNKDRRFLAEEQPKLYMQALSMQRPNPHPQKHKTLLEEEETHREEQGADTTGEVPLPEIPEVTPAPAMEAAPAEATP